MHILVLFNTHYGTFQHALRYYYTKIIYLSKEIFSNLLKFTNSFKLTD